METVLKTNKEVIRTLYEGVLNQRKFDLVDKIVSEDYISVQSERGIEAFKRSLKTVIDAFPDAKWTLEAIVAEGNTVMVRQTLTGKHKNKFQNIPPTGQTISNEGFAQYELIDGKIVRHHVQTDRFGFLQQLGVLPSDKFPPSPRSNTHVYFVDKFFVPKDAVTAFTARMDYNRTFIKSISGLIRDEVIAAELSNGDLSLMTIAVWESQAHLDNARKLVQQEYEKIHFDPKEFTERLNIRMERQLYYGLYEINICRGADQ